MQRLGLPASFVAETPLPYDVAGAVKLENQAQFHPRKYLLGLAETIPGEGSHVFENTRAHFVNQSEPCVVETEHGNVRASDVILATHLPFMDRGLFFARAHPHRSYAVAAPIDPAQAPDGMFINAGVPTRSVRTIRDGDRLLIQTRRAGAQAGAPRRGRSRALRRPRGVPARALARRGSRSSTAGRRRTTCPWTASRSSAG